MPPTRGWKILLDIDLSPRYQDKLSEKLLQVSRVNCHRGRGLCLSCVIWSVRVYTKTHAVEQNAHTRESQSEKTESKRKPNTVDNKTVPTTWLSWLFWSLNSHTGKSSIFFFLYQKNPGFTFSVRLLPCWERWCKSFLRVQQPGSEPYM